MHGTWVWALVREDPTCRGAAKPVCHNYWAREPQLLSLRATTTEDRVPRARAPQQREATAVRGLRTVGSSGPHSLQLEKARVQQRGPNAAKNK